MTDNHSYDPEYVHQDDTDERNNVVWLLGLLSVFGFLLIATLVIRASSG